MIGNSSTNSSAAEGMARRTSPHRGRQGIKRCHYDLLTREFTVRRLSAPLLFIRAIGVGDSESRAAVPCA
jgi:hypothetical protein